MSDYSKKNKLDIGYRALSRMECPCCGKYIIPRMISYEGVVIRTACPFCVHTIWRFTPSSKAVLINRLFAFLVIGGLSLPFILGLFGWR